MGPTGEGLVSVAAESRRLTRRGFRFFGVPISCHGRGYNEGKKTGVRDLFNAIYCVGRYGVSD